MLDDHVRGETDGWTRRDALRVSAAAGSGALLAGLSAGVSTTGAAGRRSAWQFFPDDVLNFQVLFAFGAAAYGAAEFGEVATVIDRVRRAGSTYDAAYREFRAMGLRLDELAEASLRRSQVASARRAYLHAAKYLSLPLFFARGTRGPAREPAAYRAMQRRWDAASQLFSPQFERVAIPYEGSSLPGYLLRPDGASAPRPTVILNNGNDAQNVDLWVYGGGAALERGWNALIFEGPGQGATWFLRRVPFRPDWEKVITPVVDFLSARPEVDAQRIAITGWSQGGQLVARAAAFEHRLAAVVLDPGVVDFLFSLRGAFPPPLRRLVAEGKRRQANQAFAEYETHFPPPAKFAVRKTLAPFGQRTFYDQVRYLERFAIPPAVAARISAPTLVTEYEGDQFFPGQGRRIFERLRGDRTLVQFGTAGGAELHDGPMAPQRRNQRVFDWLAGKLA